MSLQTLRNRLSMCTGAVKITVTSSNPGLSADGLRDLIQGVLRGMAERNTLEVQTPALSPPTHHAVTGYLVAMGGAAMLTCIDCRQSQRRPCLFHSTSHHHFFCAHYRNHAPSYSFCLSTWHSGRGHTAMHIDLTGGRAVMECWCAPVWAKRRVCGATQCGLTHWRWRGGCSLG
jgi:hypothetical protein